MTLALLWLPTAPAPRNVVYVTVSRPCPRDRALDRLSIARRVIVRTTRLPRRGIDLEVYVAQDATSRYRMHSSCGSLLALRGHARESENARLHESTKLPQSSFLTQGNIACENILRARICTAVRTGAKRAHILLCTVYIGLRIVFSPYVRKFNSWLAEEQANKKRVETSE